ncbi:helix-turn-helix domain-containing protein [Hymenobacter nivis]|uniref:AraC family transcriptional regulator n=1 Tax=Hymenobacter nivis TaxID=1850093 RepID=A0A502GC13_9BACT|nr:helix-turn-helix domain-containing protein [Hymenobacter nivis]TPG59495.1 AraC family transcriptional regulator [Hymenobacter nivis]
MPGSETIAEYYYRYGLGQPATGQVSAYRIEDVTPADSFPSLRRDFYKIKLLCNVQGIFSYANRRIEIREPALIFANPRIPHSWQRLAGRPTGYACLFTEEFVTQPLKSGSVASSPLFRVGGAPVLFPPPAAVDRLSGLFEQLLRELPSAYIHKQEVLRHYVQLLLHESLQLVPALADYPPGTAATRLSVRFLDLLAQQFPLVTPQQVLALKNANEFARHLAVHPNHLNKALKEVTGQTTTAHLAASLVAEAKALLRHSDWSLAEIGACLGFEHASNFNTFFKKQTGHPPHQYRQQGRENS